jgi:hypothetical protein
MAVCSCHSLASSQSDESTVAFVPVKALATGADPLHLALVFNIDHTNAMAYANAARNLVSSPAEQAPSRRPK